MNTWPKSTELGVKTMLIEIVTHCWRYSRCLAYQLSSLVLYPPRGTDCTLRVFCAKEDAPTVRMIEWFIKHTKIKLWPTVLPRSQLLHRAIGRNMACDFTKADWVWFTDADYFFREGCLDTLARVETKAKLIFPGKTYFTNDHAIGDRYAYLANTPGILDIDEADFKPHKLNRAIGGVQIVPGDVAREYGYCRNHKGYQSPVEGDKFIRNHSDKQFRKDLGTGGMKVDLPGVYRIRQTDFGVVDTLNSGEKQ